MVKRLPWNFAPESSGSEEKFGVEDGLRRRKESVGVCGHGIGDLGEGSKVRPESTNWRE